MVSSPVFWGWARLRLIEYMDNFREVMQSKIIRSIPEIAVYFFEQVPILSMNRSGRQRETDIIICLSD